jgi:hypothetical protein
MGDGVSSTTFWWRRWAEHSALVQMDGVPRLIGEHLDLHVVRLLQVLLEVHRVVPEGVERLALRRSPGGVEVRASLDPSHALAATAAGGLEHDRKADLLA